MAKTKTNLQDIPSNVIDKIFSDIPLGGTVSDFNSVDDFNFQEAAKGYTSRIPEYATQDLVDTGVYYDAEGQEAPISNLDKSGRFDSGIGGTGRLLRISDDIVLPDGSLVSSRETQKAIKNGVDPELAVQLGQGIAKDLAQDASYRSESISDVLDLVGFGTTGRTISQALINERKLIPYFHPELKKWVLKEATQEDFDAGAAAVSAYGPQPQSDNFANAFTKGFSNSMANLIPSVLNFNEWLGDLAQSTWNLAEGEDFQPGEDDYGDKVASRFRDSYERAQQQLSPEAQEPLSGAAGFAGALGQGVGSLLQYGILGRASTGFGVTTGKQATKLLGANAVANLEKAGMINAGLILNGGEAYQSAKDSGLPEEDAALLALATGSINTAVELGFGSNNLQRWLIGGRGAKEVPRIILEETGGDLSKLAGSRANIISRISQRIDDFTKVPVIGQAFEEGSEEFMQSLVNSTGQFLYNYTNLEDEDREYGEGLFNPKNISDVFIDAFTEASIGAILGGAAGVISKNDVKERETIMPFIIEDKSDLVKSSLTEMSDKGLITPEAYDNYINRVEQLDKLWKTNSSVFDPLVKASNESADQIKNAALSLIDKEFELKQERQNLIEKLGEVSSDPETSDAVKQERSKQVQSQIDNISNTLGVVTNQISDLIPNENGEIGQLNKINRYNEMRDFIISESNKIVPINEEEASVIFNYTNLTNDLNNLLEESLETGFSDEVKQRLSELTGLDNKDQFIDNVINTREAITNARKKQEQVEKDKQHKEQVKTANKERSEVKKKAAKQKGEPVAKETEDDFDNIFKDVEEAPIAQIETPDATSPEESIVEPLVEESPSNEAKITEIERRRQEELNKAEESWQNNVDERGFPKESLPPILQEINAKYDAEIAALEEPAQEIEEPIEPSDNLFPQETASGQEGIETVSEAVELTPEEDAVLTSINSDEVGEAKEILNSDGLVKNHTDITKFDPKFQIFDTRHLRDVGNTITSLGINYTPFVGGNVATKRTEGKLLDNLDEDGNLLINENFDSRLQDPQQFAKGDTAGIIFPTYQQMVERGVTDDYTESLYNQHINDPEMIPIAFVDSNNKIIGYLPTVEGVERNVQKEFRQGEIVKNKRLRNTLLSNPDKKYTFEITKKSSGVPLFSNNKGTIYNKLGDGKSLGEGVKIAVFKNNSLLSGDNAQVNNIKLPTGVNLEEYFQEGVVYTIIPTADGDTNFAIPADVSNISQNDAETVLHMIDLFTANTEPLIQERDDISSETDFSNLSQTLKAINNIIYTTEKLDSPYAFKLSIDKNNRKLRLGATKDKIFDLKDLKKEGTRNAIKKELQKRYYAVKVNNMNKPYTSFKYNSETQKLDINSYDDYNDYLNDNSVILTNLQSEPIEGTSRRYYTAQSVIEISDPVIQQRQLESREGVIETIEAPRAESKPVTKQFSNPLGARFRGKSGKPPILEDFDAIVTPNASIDQQAEEMMRKCRK